MKYVYDQPLPSKPRIARQETKERHSTVQSSKPKKSSSGTKKKPSRNHEKDDSSDEERVYVVRPELKNESRTARETPLRSEETSSNKATTGPLQSQKATVDRKPPQRRHTAPVPVVEVGEEDLK